MAEVVERTGVPLDTVIDYTPLPLLWKYDGLSFVALQTGKALGTEGAAMHHCVASYWRNVVNGQRSVRTAAVSRRWNSLVGRHNTKGQRVSGNTAAIR